MLPRLSKLTSKENNVVDSIDTEKKKIEEGFAKLEKNIALPEDLLKHPDALATDKRTSSQLLQDELSHFNFKSGGLLSDSNLFDIDKTPTKQSYHTFIGRTPSLKLEGESPNDFPTSREASDAVLQSNTSKSKK